MEEEEEEVEKDGEKDGWSASSRRCGAVGKLKRREVGRRDLARDF